MASFDSVIATTELEAVNLMLSTIGEAPLADQTALDNATAEDVVAAKSILKTQMRRCLLKKWEFNTELSLRIDPTDDDFSWTDPDGTSQTIGVYKPPAGLLDFQVSLTSAQQGAQYIDTVIRPSKQYVETLLPVLVFYDRYNNRDGFLASERSYIEIDAVWSMDFTDLPEVARQYITIKAARLFQKSVVGDRALHVLTEEDEVEAWKDLKRRHGLKTDLNMLDNADVSKHLGLRPRGPSGYSDLRRGHLGLL